MSDEVPLGTQAEALQVISSTEGLFLLPLTDIDNSIPISQAEKCCPVRGKWKKQQAINICSLLKENFNDTWFAYQMWKVKRKIINVEDELKLTLIQCNRIKWYIYSVRKFGSLMVMIKLYKYIYVHTLYKQMLYICMHMSMLRHFSWVQLFVTLWTVACQVPLSMGFSREYWNGFLYPPPGELLDPGIESVSLESSALQADSLPTGPSRTCMCLCVCVYICVCVCVCVCVYTHACIYICIHTSIYTYTQILEGLRCQPTVPCGVWPCLPLQSHVPSLPPALSLSTLASLSSATHLMFPAACYSFCLGGSSSIFSPIISCSSYRPQFKSHLPRKPSQTTTPLPGPPKTGQTPLYSTFRDYIPFLVLLSLVSLDLLLFVVILFICLLWWNVSSKREGLCSPFRFWCLEKDLVFRRGSRNTCGLNK